MKKNQGEGIAGEHGMGCKVFSDRAHETNDYTNVRLMTSDSPLTIAQFTP